MADENVNDLSINSTLGHYRIVSKLGAGGMGEVFLAEDVRLDRRVALKILPEQFAAGAEGLKRFIQEAKSASALNHRTSSPFSTSSKRADNILLRSNTSTGRPYASG